MAKACHQAECVLGPNKNVQAIIPKKTAIGNADRFFIISAIIHPSVKSAITPIITGTAANGNPQTAIRKRPSPGPKIIKPIEAKKRR